MKVITQKKNSHIDYVNVTKARQLTENLGKPCNQRDLPCSKQSR